ncbi:MAG: ABC transporter permease [Thermoplasmata archaeon]|nr:ABC transporter permease [Thermoplasmata archaeon]
MRPRRILADFAVFSKGYVRNPIALFFSLVFPIILIAMFGFIFQSGTTKVNLYVENLDHNSNASRTFLTILNHTGAVNVNLVAPSDANASGGFGQYLSNNGYTVGLVIPAGFGAAYLAGNATSPILYTDPQDLTSGGVAEGACTGVANAMNLAASHGKQVVTISNANVGSQVLKYIDYLVPGLVGFTILTSPMFAMVDISSSYRKDHIFRQLSLTPLTKGEWLTAKIIWYIALTFLTTAIMLSIGTFAFGAHVTVGLGLLPFLILGPFFFVSLGMLAGSIAKTPESAAVIGNVVTFPMMFLSGTFFPVSGFNPQLQAVAHALPLYYVIDGMNQTMLFQHYGTTLWIDFAVVFVGSIVVFIAAILAFRWRDE